MNLLKLASQHKNCKWLTKRWLIEIDSQCGDGVGGHKHGVKLNSFCLRLPRPGSHGHTTCLIRHCLSCHSQPQCAQWRLNGLAVHSSSTCAHRISERIKRCWQLAPIVPAQVLKWTTRNEWMNEFTFLSFASQCERRRLGAVTAAAPALPPTVSFIFDGHAESVSLCCRKVSTRRVQSILRARTLN